MWKPAEGDLWKLGEVERVENPSGWAAICREIIKGQTDSIWQLLRELMEDYQWEAEDVRPLVDCVCHSDVRPLVGCMRASDGGLLWVRWWQGVETLLSLCDWAGPRLDFCQWMENQPDVCTLAAVLLVFFQELAVLEWGTCVDNLFKRRVDRASGKMKSVLWPRDLLE